MIDPADADMTVALFTDALVDAVDAGALLREWSIRYPELRPEFAAIVVDRQVDEQVSDPENVAAQTHLMRRLAVEERSRLVAAPIIETQSSGFDSLPAAVSARGLSYPADLADRLRLPASIVERIVSRRIPVSTLPSVLIQQLAGVLAVTGADVLTWLGGTPANPRLAAAVVRETAAVYGSSSFADAIANAADFDVVDRAYWQSVVALSRAVDDRD